MNITATEAGSGGARATLYYSSRFKRSQSYITNQEEPELYYYYSSWFREELLKFGRALVDTFGP